MKTGILCHGRHVLANNWELHQFGDEKNNLLGQILKTLIVSNQENPEIVVFVTPNTLPWGSVVKTGIWLAEP